MSSPYTIRRLEAAEFGVAAELWEDSVRATHGFLTNEDVLAMRPEVEALLPRMPLLFGAFHGSDELLGIVGVQQQNVDLLFVHPKAFRQGIGALLMRHVMALCGARTVDVNEDNAGARQFYEQLGFTVFKRSEKDGAGRPFPILHMRLKDASAASGTKPASPPAPSSTE